MSYARDPRIDQAKTIPMAEVIDRLGIAGLRAQGAERVGPCPHCGGRDRFAINMRTHAFQCRKCGIKGGDQIALVREILSLGFADALSWLCGDRPAEVDPERIARNRARAAEAERRQARDAERYRRKAIHDAQAIWSRALRGGDLAAAYLRARGIDPAALPAWPKVLRFLPDHPYVKKLGRDLVTLHRGPCLIAAIQGQTDKLCAVHQTWIASAPPHVKARIAHEGETYPAKLVRGSKKGGAIRLHTPAGTDTLVMGEGIETTLSALVAGALPGAAYWAGVDLGNMGGRALRGPGLKYAGQPDMEDADAFVPPPWVRRLVFIQDGDSDPRATRHRLECGLRRAMALRPGLRAQIIQAGQGVDLNDVLTGKGRVSDYH